MATKVTEREKSALLKKAESPQDVVLCPRCGHNLEYREVGASYEVKCNTSGCLKMAVRGV